MTEANDTIFKTVPRGRFNPIYSDGSLNPVKVLQFLNLCQEDMKKLTGMKSVRLDDRMSDDLRLKILEIANLIELTAQYFDNKPAKMKAWMLSHNPKLNNLRPIDWVKDNKIQELMLKMTSSEG